jgi:hypothetical protein
MRRDDIDNVFRLDEARRRHREEYQSAWRDRKGCRHRIVRDKQLVQSILRVIEQIPKRDLCGND